MNKKMLILSASVLLAGVALTGCNGEPQPAESSSEASTSSEETVAGKVIIAETQETADEIGKTVLPKDIALDQVVNLEDHVQVTKVNSWSLSTNSTNVEITGHSFKATDYGSYTITLTAGTTKRSIKGNVVTTAKLKFNNVFDGLETNYMAGSTFTGVSLVNKNFWMSYVDDTATSYVFEGGINHPSDGFAYPFSILATESRQELVFGDSIEIKHGYAKSVAAHGFGKEFGELKGSDFIQEFDQEGDPTGYYFLEDGDESEDGSTKISRFVDSVLGEEAWYLYQSYVAEDDDEVLNLSAKYSPSAGEMTFYPVNSKGMRVTSVTVQGQSYDTALTISMIGEVELDACDAWRANPVVPEQISASPIKSFFEDLAQEKQFAVNSVGTWYNTTTGAATECPEYMHFSDTHTALFGNFEADAMANANIYEMNMVDYADDITPPDDETGMPAKGESAMYFINNHTFCYASSAYDAATQQWAYGSVAAGTSSQEISSIWDTVFIYVSAFLTEDNTNMLDLVSWTDLTEKEGSKVFSYNTFGPDSAYGPNQFQYGISYFASTFVPYDMAVYPIFYTSYLGWWDYMSLSFEIDNDGEWLKWAMDFEYSETVHYELSATISKVETDPVSAAALAAYAAYIGE